MDLKVSDFCRSVPRCFTAAEALAVKCEAEESALRASAVTRVAEEALALGASKRDPKDELALGASLITDAREELVLKNSAPSSAPCRHFMRAVRPALFFDRIKVNVLGRL
jgi:hypothetical protein